MTDFLQQVNKAIVNPLITLLIAVALVVFLYGTFEFVRGSSSSADRERGSKHMLWGIVGLVIMVSAFGLINLICSTIGAQC